MNEKTYRFHFYQNRKIYFAISIVVLVVGILASIIIGPKLDIQFAGGSMILYSVEDGRRGPEHFGPGRCRWHRDCHCGQHWP